MTNKAYFVSTFTVDAERWQTAERPLRGYFLIFPSSAMLISSSQYFTLPSRLSATSSSVTQCVGCWCFKLRYPSSGYVGAVRRCANKEIRTADYQRYKCNAMIGVIEKSAYIKASKSNMYTKVLLLNLLLCFLQALGSTSDPVQIAYSSVRKRSTAHDPCWPSESI